SANFRGNHADPVFAYIRDDVSSSQIEATNVSIVKCSKIDARYSVEVTNGAAAAEGWVNSFQLGFCQRICVKGENSSETDKHDLAVAQPEQFTLTLSGRV